jgi:hypothetical protein
MTLKIPDTRVKRIQIDMQHIYHENMLLLPKQVQAVYDIKVETWEHPFTPGCDVLLMPPKEKEKVWVTGMWCEEQYRSEIMLIFFDENRLIELDTKKYSYLGALQFERKNSEIHVFKL